MSVWLFANSCFFSVWTFPLLLGNWRGLGGQANWTDERTNEQRHPRRVISVPLGWPGLGWIEYHLYAYYILLTTYYLITRRESKEERKEGEAVGDTEAQFRFRDPGV